MKILVVSLLRLGDLLMQKNLLGSVAKKYPQAEIHFLIYREFQAANHFLTEVHKFHYFERTEWSNWINQAEVPLLKPVKELGKLINSLNEEKFDRVWNWTHQKSSAYLMELIQSKEKVGLQTKSGKFTLGGSENLKDFNKQFTELNNEGPHYLVHLAKIFNLEIPSPKFMRSSLREDKENLICIQPLTSDAKKNWDLRFFREWISQHQRLRPQDQICVFGSPAEKTLLEREFPLHMVKILKLYEVEKILANADLLLTVDTAIKHLATLAGTQILELSFGSAQPKKTGAWMNEYHVIVPTVDCWPCSHSKNCSQATHACAEELTAMDLGQIVVSLIEGKQHKKLKKYNNTILSSGGTHVEGNRKLLSFST